MCVMCHRLIDVSKADRRAASCTLLICPHEVCGTNLGIDGNSWKYAWHGINLLLVQACMFVGLPMRMTCNLV